MRRRERAEDRDARTSGAGGATVDDGGAGKPPHQTRKPPQIHQPMQKVTPRRTPSLVTCLQKPNTCTPRTYPTPSELFYIKPPPRRCAQMSPSSTARTSASPAPAFHRSIPPTQSMHYCHYYVHRPHRTRLGRRRATRIHPSKTMRTPPRTPTIPSSTLRLSSRSRTPTPQPPRPRRRSHQTSSSPSRSIARESRARVAAAHRAAPRRSRPTPRTRARSRPPLPRRTRTPIHFKARKIQFSLIFVRDINKDFVLFMRLDKYLWALRYFKTRNIATEACKKGQIRVNDHIAKPSR